MRGHTPPRWLSAVTYIHRVKGIKRFFLQTHSRDWQADSQATLPPPLCPAAEWAAGLHAVSEEMNEDPERNKWNLKKQISHRITFLQGKHN